MESSLPLSSMLSFFIGMLWSVTVGYCCNFPPCPLVLLDFVLHCLQTMDSLRCFPFFFFFPLLSPHSISQSWVPLKYHSSESDFSARYLQKMVAEDNSPIQFLMSPYAFYLFINAFFFCSCVVFNQRG